MSGRKAEKRSLPGWMLLVAAYLCFVAELAFIIMGDINYGILFAGLYFCLVIVFFVLWREEQSHKLLILQSSLDDALRRESLENKKKEHEQMRRLRQEKEELDCERKQAQGRVEKLALENESLTRQLEAAKRRESEISGLEAAERILPQDENPTELDLVAVITRIIAEREDACRKSGIRLRFSCQNEVLFYRTDERYIRLILYNIIDNTVKYMGRNGSLVITLSHLGNRIFLACKDDGMGLPQREAEHIFALNFQGSNRMSGSGLGLAQVRAVVCRLGGTVYARSKDGMGIYIQIPVSREAEDGIHGTEEEKAGETAGERDGKNKDIAGGE